jgi:hypothetical protein
MRIPLLGTVLALYGGRQPSGAHMLDSGNRKVEDAMKDKRDDGETLRKESGFPTEDTSEAGYGHRYDHGYIVEKPSTPKKEGEP